MLFNLIKILSITLFIGIFTVPALAQYAEKDSFYFMKDDGIFSPEEKDEEAEGIKQQCEISTLEQKYYDCGCLAGAFRIKRDQEKLTPQNNIVYDLLNDEETKCVDTSKIAGNIFSFCKGFTKVFRPREKDNEQYCECVANTVASDFAKKPRLKSRYINNIKVNAMSSCNIRYK